jgi:hypothetical protein
MSYQLYVANVAPGILKYPMNLAFIVENGKALGKVAVGRRIDSSLAIAFEFNRVDHTIPLYLVIGNDGDTIVTQFRQTFHYQIDLTVELSDQEQEEMDQDLRATGFGSHVEKGSGLEGLKKLFVLE